MAKALKNTLEYAPFSFMGLMASKGKVPGAISKSADKEFMSVMIESTVREAASDLTATGDFFSFMVENGLMNAEAPAKRYNIKITRPASLGGDFGGSFGGGALVH